MDGTPKKPKPLTRREKKFFKNVIAGMTLTAAALDAGYSPNSPGQAGFQTLERIKLKAPGLLERHDLGEDALIEKYLKPALEANETKFFQKDGFVTDSRDVIAWGPRLTALDMAAKISGLYARPEDEGGSDRARMTLILDIPRPGKLA